MMRHRQRPKETDRSLMRRLVLIAGGPGVHKLLGVLLQGGPPEPLQKDIPCHRDPRMAGQLGGVGPQKNVGLEVQGDDQVIRRAGAGAGLVLNGGPYSLLNLPGKGGVLGGSREDRFGPYGRILLHWELT